MQQMLAISFALLVAFAHSGSAQNTQGEGRGDPAQMAETARQATRAVDQVAQDLRRLPAEPAYLGDMVRLLGEYEQHLEELRELRDAAAERIAALHDAQKTTAPQIPRALGALALYGDPILPPELRPHPNGSLAQARAAMLARALLPELQARAGALQYDTRRVEDFRVLQDRIDRQLQSVATNRTRALRKLRAMIADGPDAPRAFQSDSIQTAVILASSDTVAEFLANLKTQNEAALAPSQAASLNPGSLLGPIHCTALATEALSAHGEGYQLNASVGSVVTAPAAATIHYHGTLFDLGNAVVMQLSDDIMLVFAGLGEIYAEAGEIIPACAPLGRLPDVPAEAASNPSEGAGVSQRNTLYIEMIQGTAPSDPVKWFSTEEG